MSQNWVLMVTELRRYPQMSYKSDIVVLSGKFIRLRTRFYCLVFQCNVIISLTILFEGLDTGDRKALDHKFSDSQCLMDTEDRRFVLKGPQFPPMEVSLMNTILIVSLEKRAQIHR